MPEETPIFFEYHEGATQTLENILGIRFSRSDNGTYESHPIMDLNKLLINGKPIRNFTELFNNFLQQHIEDIAGRRERQYQDSEENPVQIGLSLLNNKLTVTERPGSFAVLTVEALSAEELNQLIQMKQAADTDTADALKGIQFLAQGYVEGMIAQKSLE